VSEDATDLKFSASAKQVLASVLDEIIPPSDDGRMPGAGQIGVADHVEQALQNLPDLRAMILRGLADLDALAHSRHARSFTALSRQDKVVLLNEQGFVFPLTFHAYVGYYQHARIAESLGLEPRPPHPTGYEMEPDDLTLLDTVRRRGRLYRPC